LSGTLTGSAVLNALKAAGYGGDAGGFYFGNFADTTTKGLDLVANYTTRFDEYGVVKWGLAGNISRNWFDRIKVPAGAPSGLTLIDRATEGNFTKASPSSKVVLTADWMLGTIESFIRVTRYGSILAENDIIALDEKVSPKFIVDLSVSYDITDNLRTTLGADNLFNTYPPNVQLANQANGAAYYNAASPWGISGGYYYGKVSYKF
jgi:iron complex outermembrane receptor protein